MLRFTHDYSKAWGRVFRKPQLSCIIHALHWYKPSRVLRQVCHQRWGLIPPTGMWAPLPWEPSYSATTLADIKGLLHFSYVTLAPFLLSQEEAEQQTPTNRQLTHHCRWVTGVQVLREFRQVYCHCAVCLQTQILEKETNRRVSSAGTEMCVL